MKDSPNCLRLIEHWKTQGPAIAKGVGESELAAFENREGVCIPNEFRSYLSTVNGMCQGHDSDGNLFAFWPLARIKSVRQECLELSADETADNFFVFADFMIWSWAYAVEMGNDPYLPAKVILVGGMRPHVSLDLLRSLLRCTFRMQELSTQVTRVPTHDSILKLPVWCITVVM